MFLDDVAVSCNSFSKTEMRSEMWRFGNWRVKLEVICFERDTNYLKQAKVTRFSDVIPYIFISFNQITGKKDISNRRKISWCFHKLSSSHKITKSPTSMVTEIVRFLLSFLREFTLLIKFHIEKKVQSLRCFRIPQIPASSKLKLQVFFFLNYALIINQQATLRFVFIV